MKKVFIYATALVMAFAIASCEEETPKDHMKNAGEEMKKAGEKAGDNIKENIEETKQDIKDDHPN